MDFEIDQVAPVNAPNGLSENSSFWDQKLTFIQGKKYGVHAGSGKGKSTLIHFLYGIRRDYSGKIVYGRQDLYACTKDQLADLRAKEWTIIFQDLRLFPELTVGENLMIVNSNRNEAENLLEQLGLGNYQNQPVTKISQGERQRVAIVRALLRPFSWIFLDEPFSHLDPENRERAMKLIFEKCENQNAGLVCTSLTEEAYPTEMEWIKL